MAGLRGTGFGDADRFSIDGPYNTFPAGQSFSEIEFDRRYEVVALTLEGGMFFL